MLAILQLQRATVKIILPVLLTLCWAPRLQAQAYIEHSRVLAGNGGDITNDLVVDATGNSYILATTGGTNYPVTLGSVPSNSLPRAVLTKLDPSGNIIWSRYLPFGAIYSSTYVRLLLQDGTLYLLGSTSTPDIPVTDGSTFGGGTFLDVLFTKVDAATGAVLHNGYLGGNGADGFILDMALDNGDVYITYASTSSNIPVTTGPAFAGGYDRVIQKLDGAGHIVYSTYIGNLANNGPTNNIGFAVENGMAYVAVQATVAGNFSTTDGSTLNNGSPDFGLVKLDASGNRVLAKLIGGGGTEAIPHLLVKNGEMYLAGNTNSSDYPVTDGSPRPAGAGVVLTKVNSSGNIAYSGYRAGIGANASTGTLAWVNNSLYMAFAAALGQPVVAVTDGSSGGSFLIKVEPSSGATQFATRYGQVRGGTFTITQKMTADNTGIYITSPIQTSAGSPPTGFTTQVTDGSSWTGRSGTFVTKHSLDGQLQFASFLVSPGSTTNPAPFTPAVSNGKLYVAGNTQLSQNYPVTIASAGTLSPTDAVWTVYSFCPALPTTNTINPLSQTICENGLTQLLTGNEVAYSSSDMPVLYINGAPTEQTEIRGRYQWQSSASDTGPWTNIQTGTQRDYLPAPAAQTTYYRRLVLPPTGCGETPVSISGVAEVVVNSDASPMVTSTVFTTCVNTPIDINVTVSGGSAPYTFAWDNGITSITNTATVTPAANGVYTATVTDANGCRQIGQVIVNAYMADAGPATAAVCAGKAVRIGTPPPAGLTGVTWSWSPTTGLDDPTIAQPLATPGSSTVYTVQMTIPTSGGSTCTTSDNITVDVEAGPATANFAGPDKAVCFGGTALLGSPAESGFTYTWSPGNYLNNASLAMPTFSAGTNLPQPDPFTYTLSASRNGCTFTDQVSVAALQVDAGEDYCGPRTVGTPDKMPGVTGKTWLWEVVSGPGLITGPSNTPTTTVSASTGGATTYRVTVSYLGTNCSDDVVVGDDCSAGCPNIRIDTVADHNCPSTSFGSVTLVAVPSNLSPAQWTYSWSAVPAGGLSATTGSFVTLTDNVESDVTVTITRVDNPLFTCSKTIHVNNPLWALPAFSAVDATVCPGTSVAIGGSVASYGFTWQNVHAGDENISNPSVSPATTTSYPVEVTDVTSGCTLFDTATVKVKPFVIDPGPDWIACSNALVTLGTPALPGYNYTWSPQVASYQNGTTYQSAQPQLLIASMQDYTLTVTDTESGCTGDSTVHIVIDNSSTLPAMNDTTICFGGSANIGLPAWPGVTYSWAPATGLSSIAVAQPVASPTATQTYTLTVTFYDAGGAVACTKSGSVTVNVNAPQITMSDESICPSGALYNLETGVTVTGAASYSWSPAILVTDSTALNTTVKANPHDPVTFTLTAKDAGGCAASASKVVSPINAAPEAGSAGIICAGDNRTLGASSNTGTLSWTVNPAIAGTLSPANGAQPVFTPAAADAGKTFTFTITQDIGGCINTDSVRIQVRSLVLPSMQPQTVCMNAAATIGVTAQPGVAYAWSPTTGLSDPSAATTSIANVTSNTIYKLTAVDGYGCSATATTAIGVSATTAPAVTVPDVKVTVGTPGTAFAPQISPMPAAYTYSWTPANKVDNPYIANATAIPESVGTYYYNFSVTDANGCTSTANARLNVTAANTILPVTLASFKATTQGCGVRIEWKVEMAEHFSHFVLERSSDGVVYQSITQIALKEGRSYYSYDDVDPGNGRWVYRLKLVDIDEQFTYSRVAVVKIECALKGTLSVYPNPVKDRIYVKNSKAVKSILLIAVTGQVMERYEYNQTQPATIWMPLSNKINRGIYFLLITATDGSVQNNKVIKD